MSDADVISLLLGAFSLFYAVFMAFVIFIASLILVSNAEIYRKAGYASWKSIIPLYASYIQFEFTWGNGWFFLLLMIPVVNAIISVMTLYKLSKVFGGGVGTFLLLWLVPFVGYPMVAYKDEYEYVGIDSSDDEDDESEDYDEEEDDDDEDEEDDEE